MKVEFRPNSRPKHFTYRWQNKHFLMTEMWNQSIWLDWKRWSKRKNLRPRRDRPIRYYPLVAPIFHMAERWQGHTSSLRSNNRSYNIYINIWRSTAARYCSSWEKISRPPATTRLSHPIRKRDAKNRVSQQETIKLNSMLIDLPTWKSTRRPCPRYK